MSIPHPPSCSLVSCLSLNIPTLIISVHGLDITTNSSLTSPLLAIDLSSFETLIKTSLLPSKHPNRIEPNALVEGRTNQNHLRTGVPEQRKTFLPSEPDPSSYDG
jgi:hypothetical protein